MHTPTALHLLTIVNRVACSSLMGYLGASLHCINDGVATDPACGSGNFLTETYISLRRLENEAIAALQHGQVSFG